MNETIRKALAHLEAEESRLRQLSIEADKRAADAREVAEAVEDEWRATKDALKALMAYTSDRSEVRF